MGPWSNMTGVLNLKTKSKKQKTCEETDTQKRTLCEVSSYVASS